MNTNNSYTIRNLANFDFFRPVPSQRGVRDKYSKNGRYRNGLKSVAKVQDRSI